MSRFELDFFFFGTAMTHLSHKSRGAVRSILQTTPARIPAYILSARPGTKGFRLNPFFPPSAGPAPRRG